jgi:hypothetical protein
LTKLEERLKALGVEGGCVAPDNDQDCDVCKYDWNSDAMCEGFIMGKLLEIIEYQKDVIEKIAREDD